MEKLQNDRVSRLLRETRAGEDDAFYEIALQYKPLIENCICYFYGKISRDELEQEALIALYRAACTYDTSVNNVSFGLYAKICINNSLISLSRSVKSENLLVDESLIDVEISPDLDPSVDYISRESFVKLDSFVRQHLSEYEYSVFRLYIEGYRIKEIAAKLNKTDKSVADAIMRLKIKLRSSLTKYDL